MSGEFPTTLENFQNWLAGLGSAALGFLIKAAIAVVVFIVVLAITKKLCRWLEGRMEKWHADPSLNSFIVSLVKYGIIIFALVTIIVQLNIVEASSIAALIASGGVAVSLALQGGLSNFAGGVMLLFLKPFRAGDYIQVKAENVEGTVQRIEMYYTTILGIDYKTHMIPNSKLTGNTITNFTAMEKRRFDQKIGISYSSDLKKAKEIVEEVLKADPRILDGEETQVFVSSLGESSVQLGYRAWVKTADYWQTFWDLNENIKLTLEEHGIEIPYNQLDVHIRE